MIFIGDCFAIVIISILCLFYFEKQFYFTPASKYFALCLVFNGINAILDIASTIAIYAENVPIVTNAALNLLYFSSNIIATTTIAMVLFSKILEHVHRSKCKKRAMTGLVVIFAVYQSLVLINPLTGWLFYFENGVYTRGVLNSIGYMATVMQMTLVIICYIKNKESVSKAMKRVLWQAFPIAIFFIVVQLVMPDILLNSIVMALVNLIIFINFHNQNAGTHALTKLNDRHLLHNHIENCIKYKKRFKIFVIKLRDFEVLNQKYGHTVGDELLYLLAFSLEKKFSYAMAFNMDSLSFAITIDEKDGLDDPKHLQRLRAFLDKGIEYGDIFVNIEYMIVEHVLSDECTDANLFYEELEYGVDLARQSGSNYLKYDEAMTREMLRRKYLIDKLQHVDKIHGYELWFQPISCVSTCRFCSMEALIRLREYDGSLISPAEFIPLAEETDMIEPITWFVIEESCRALSQNRFLDGVNVSINLPMKQLLDPKFENRINQITALYNIEHSRICLEFTERAMHADFNAVKQAMQRISAHGYRFFLDDFGTGLSNFNCLLELPFESIKLDMELTTTIDTNPDCGLVKMLINLFHNMDLTVIAEGVETKKQVDALLALYVDKIQGYYYSAPLPINKLEEFYKNYQ